MNGITIERTSIRATPGGDIVRSVSANTKIAYVEEIGSWYRVVAVDWHPQSGYINARSVKVTDEVVVTPPPVDPPTPPVTPTGVVHSIFVREDGKINIDGLGYE